MCFVVVFRGGSRLTRWQFLVPIILCPVFFIALVIVIVYCRHTARRRRHTLPETEVTSSRVCWPHPRQSFTRCCRIGHGRSHACNDFHVDLWDSKVLNAKHAFSQITYLFFVAIPRRNLQRIFNNCTDYLTYRVVQKADTLFCCLIGRTFVIILLLNIPPHLKCMLLHYLLQCQCQLKTRRLQ